MLTTPLVGILDTIRAVLEQAETGVPHRLRRTARLGEMLELLAVLNNNRRLGLRVLDVDDQVAVQPTEVHAWHLGNDPVGIQVLIEDFVQAIRADRRSCSLDHHGFRVSRVLQVERSGWAQDAGDVAGTRRVVLQSEVVAGGAELVGERFPLKARKCIFQKKIGVNAVTGIDHHRTR